MTYDNFCRWWDSVDRETKISSFMDYCSENGCDSAFWDFDDDFFQMFVHDPMEICRATVYGHVDFQDSFIRKDDYGNFETLSYFEAAEEADRYKREIYESGCYESHIKNILEYEDY